MPDERWGETVKAAVAFRAGCDVAPADLIHVARQHLSYNTCPTSVDVVPGLRRNAAGKVR